MSRAAPTRAPLALPGDAAERGTPVEVVTPEGVPLVFRAAPVGDRLAALLIDLLLLALALVALGLVFLVVGDGELDGGWAETGFLLAAFALRYGGFTVFELRGRGATPGKRLVGLRVVDAAGGPLRAEAVLVRNLAREVEVFLPLSVLLVPDLGGEAASAWVRLVAAAWTFGFSMVPWLNRRRLRLGDFVAGTMVVVVPRATLLADVARAAPAAASAAARASAPEPTSPGAGPAFSPAQLDVYGVFELQVLEDVLRPGPDRRARQDALVAVAARIRKKIEWAAPVAAADVEPFLRAYYAALRAHLERRMLLGGAKSDKHAK